MPKSQVRTRLLVVLADDDARLFLRRRLERLGYEVIEAGGHAQALSLAGAEALDLALVDLQTSGPKGEDGLELVRGLREVRPAAELPILAIAEQGATEDAGEALMLGADDCLLRPLYVDLAHARAQMLIGPRGKPPARKGRGELQARLETLEESTERTQAVSAALVEIGLDGIAPINGLLGATAALTAICRGARLNRSIERIETAAAALDLVMVRALGRADRRARAPKTRLNVLLSDRDAAGREQLRELLNAAEVEVDLVEAAGGSQAVLATDTRFFDLIVMSVSGPEEIAGIQAIRRAERQNRTRRTPILAVGPRSVGATQAFDAGADLYVQQPVTPERLLGNLADALVWRSEEVSAVA